MNVHRPIRLLASDLDGTLFPPRDDASHTEALRCFEALLALPAAPVLAYVTGRHLSSALEVMERWSLPRPDRLVCDVGTSLHHPVGEDAWRLDEKYADCMTTAMGGLTAADIVSLLDGIAGLELQEAQRQSAFKTSYLMPSGEDGDAAYSEVEAGLISTGVDLFLVRSTGVYEDCDLLDVLPSGVSKATAVAHLAAELGDAPGAILYAGDSRNDLEPLLAADLGVVVGDAEPGLVAALDIAFAGCWPADRMHRANRPHLHGVLAGCRHFGLQ